MSELISSWPHWTRPYWLLAIPVAALLLWGLYRAQSIQRDWRTVLPKAFHAILLNQHAPQQRNRRYWFLAGAWLCALLALLGPNWETTTEQPRHERYFSPLVIVIQLTHDMLANDLAPRRLEHVREKVFSVLKKREAAFTAIVVYAGSAHTLVPLSNDLLTSENLLQALEPNLMPTPGQRADLAIERAVNLLQQGAQGAGQILLISTGVSVSEQNAIAKLIKQHPIQLSIMGVGTSNGAPILESVQGHFLTDSSGAIVISRLNETSLQLLGKQTDSPYIQLTDDNSDLFALNLFGYSEDNLTAAIAAQITDKQDQGYWFIFPILILAVYFSRRGSLLVLLVCLLPMSSFAFELDDVWLRPDQQGAKLLDQQPALAAQHFTDLQWRATALYLAEDYQSAAKLFARFDSAAAQYNRGNALALAGLLKQAVQAYKQALKQDPEMLAAQYNLSIVEDALKATPRSNDHDKASAAEQNQTSPATQQLSDAAPASTATTTRPEAEEQKNTESTTANTAPQLGSDSQAPAQHTELSSNLPTPAPEPFSPLEPPLDLERWLEQIPDNPGELLKRKFWYEENMQESTP